MLLKRVKGLNMKLLTLDLSTKSSGWCFGQNQKIQKYGYFVASDKILLERIIKMRQQIIDFIKNNHVDKIVAEQVIPSDYNLHTGIVLRWLQGIIVLAVYEINPKIQVQFLHPQEWRASLKIKQGKGIKRDQLKNSDIQYVKQKYKIIPKNDDEADAICLYDAYWNKKDNEMNWE